MASTVSVSKLAGLMKGATSRMWDLEFPDTALSWQDGFWAESCSPDELRGLIEYIVDQRAHHCVGGLKERWEAPSAAR
jgi:REP element-mobilizing transposase RayT